MGFDKLKRQHVEKKIEKKEDVQNMPEQASNRLRLKELWETNCCQSASKFSANTNVLYPGVELDATVKKDMKLAWMEEPAMVK
ncbi:hypothetical protein JRQ81_001739 [Phrynocephalus forsythii]|uniref:Uncharacterized protein n=1 Tax=Phrynocephalus forsythii TaxID=171643 RepID=A0A9Q0YBM3_9SAUR|nr:hypothetical protein JRQ81_001739 [Phrynocephalus forsythii]